MVVLDGDIDGSADVLAPWRVEVPLRIVSLPENRGRSAALNAGFAAAAGDVLVRCDDDLAPRPDYVSQHVARHGSGTCGAIGHLPQPVPGDGVRPGLRPPLGHRIPTPRLRLRPRSALALLGRQRLGRPRQLGARRRVRRGHRAYGWEDVDWGYRLSRPASRSTSSPGLETDHHVAATTTAGRGVRAYYAGSASRRFELKHGVDGSPTATRGLAPGGAGSRAASGAGHSARARWPRWAEAVDRVADRLPAAVATKAVALLVEAGSAAGHRRTDAGQAI